MRLIRITALEVRQTRSAMEELDLRLRLELHLAIFHLDGILHRVAAVVFADLVSLLLHESLKGIKAGVRTRLSRFGFRRHHGIEQALYILVVGVYVRT